MLVYAVNNIQNNRAFQNNSQENLNRSTSPNNTRHNIGQISSVRLLECSGYEVRDAEEVDEDDMWDKLSKISPYALVDDLQENRTTKINQPHTGIDLGFEKENGLTRYFIRLCNKGKRGKERLAKSYKLRA